MRYDVSVKSWVTFPSRSTWSVLQLRTPRFDLMWRKTGSRAFDRDRKKQFIYTFVTIHWYIISYFTAWMFNSWSLWNRGGYDGDSKLFNFRFDFLYMCITPLFITLYNFIWSFLMNYFFFFSFLYTQFNCNDLNVTNVDYIKSLISCY